MSNLNDTPQEELDAQELALGLIKAMGEEESHPLFMWVKSAYAAVLNGQSCACLDSKVISDDKIISRGKDKVEITPLILQEFASGNLLYLRHMNEMEENLATKIKEKALEIELEKQWKTEQINEIAKQDSLNDEQREALYRIAKFNLVILTGGPGTGKTHTLKSLLRYSFVAGKISPSHIRLVAPTGRASRRISDGMQSLTNDEKFKELNMAQTLHSLLYEPEAFDDIKLLIIDESSMVDLMLFNKVIDKLPDDCKLVLVGDPNQLPSVEVGSVLADLCEAYHLEKNKVKLIQQIRSKGNKFIMQVAEQVLAGSQNINIKLYEPPDAQQIIKMAVAEYSDLVNLCEKGDHVEALKLVNKVRVLCSHVRGELGAETLSAEIAESFNIKLSPPGDGALIMVTKNDRHGTGLSNGDVGVKVDGKVYFPNHVVGYNIDQLPGYSLAFATTIHKAQGSEYDLALIVLGSSLREDFLNRQLVYTSITRAKNDFKIFAETKVFQDACAKGVLRASGLKDRLS